MHGNMQMVSTPKQSRRNASGGNAQSGEITPGFAWVAEGYGSISASAEAFPAGSLGAEPGLSIGYAAGARPAIRACKHPLRSLIILTSYKCASA